MFKYTLSQSFRTSLLIQMINLCMLVLSLRPFFSFCLLRSSPPLSLPLSLHFFCFLLPLLSFSFFLILFFLSLKLYSTCFDSRSFSVSDSPSTLSPPPHSFALFCFSLFQIRNISWKQEDTKAFKKGSLGLCSHERK